MTDEVLNAIHPDFGWIWREDEIGGKLTKSFEERIKEISCKLQKIEDAIFNAHGKALPKNWVYTDSITSIDLMVAEILALREGK